MSLETHHIDNRMDRCVSCTKRFVDRDRVKPGYVAGELGVSLLAQPEMGLLRLADAIDNARPFFRHVDCDDPTLKDNPLIPSIHRCIHCRTTLGSRDFVVPVYQVIDPNTTNPDDPTDQGVSFGERIHLAHVNCRDPRLARTSALIV